MGGIDIFSLQFFVALANVIFVDLLLAGDNAIVIGMAARNLDTGQQKKAIILGTAGAVIIRIIATVLVVKLLQIPWLFAIGGALLLWISVKLLTDHNEDGNVKAGKTLMGAVWTIILADAAMGLDNVIAVAGAAHGHIPLVIIGLIISVPIVVWGSTLFIKVIDRFQWIVYIGSAVLAYNAAKMITEERGLHTFFEHSPAIKWSLILTCMVLVVAVGYIVRARSSQHNQQEQNA
ncbi:MULTISPECIES: TerC family protein [unclassified Paenibacillus]|uniref:TerC family protein n=1 Tax=unclassified Paenibacillus TaxID=185978 RepID=UPI002404F4CB|nr:MULTISPECIES: TerC family protein [unclassified Paenibacillus]